jgi:hypothetical protein
MAFQGLGLHLGVVVVTHVVKQAAIVVQEFLVYRNPVLRVSLLAVSGIFSRKHDVILHEIPPSKGLRGYETYCVWRQ